ncbi:MAG: Cys-tRNA(Pro) deacylase [Anaerolineales bacterium]|jgi:Cys-tRNA(Pro)/Cys-tRNA(Cys) deacylase|nr:Cys-tRNA(Pro) deacylase [Anaerolineales bacterium]
MNKTNAIRILEKTDISYEIREYDIDDSVLAAERVAEVLGFKPEQIFKTLILRGDRSGPMIALAPAGTEIDLRALALASGDKRVEMVPLREVRALTGYERGAVTPLGIQRSYPVFIDETVELWDRVGISGGSKGLEILLAPSDLLLVTDAKKVDFARSV